MTDFVPTGFELNNTHRKYLGLDEVEPHWDRVQLNDKAVLYFDGDVIRKMIEYSFDRHSYEETDHHEMTAENRTILLPQTARGKRKKLNYTTHSFKSQGLYFYFSPDYIVIGNFTTQTSFYHETYKAELRIDEWLDKWVRETTDTNLRDLQQFKNSKRVHQKYAEGDFFVFRVGRNKRGFGRILLNIYERRKSGDFKNSNYGLTSLTGRALYIGIYRYLSDSPEVDIDRLRQCAMLPTQPIIDNRFFYGEFKIIGNREIRPEEWEPLVIYSTCLREPGVTYLQYGLVFLQRPTRKSDPFLKADIICRPIFSGGGIGFLIKHYSDLENIIMGNVDNDSLLRDNDLRKRSNHEAKQAIFRSFSLDADKSYAENLRIFEESTASRTSTPDKKSLLSFLRKIF